MTTIQQGKKNTVKRGKAMYSFKGEKVTDLVFNKGDEVIVLNEDPSGWWEGKLVRNGDAGLFPYNYFDFDGKS